MVSSDAKEPGRRDAEPGVEVVHVPAGPGAAGPRGPAGPPDTSAPATRRRIERRLQELHASCQVEPAGRVDRYYRSGYGYLDPAEVADEADRFAISVATVEGDLFEVGDTDVTFHLHSISKVLAYGLALADHGVQHVLERVGVEPSGEAFNALRFDERRRRPFNPMVNAGALVTTSLVRGADPDEQTERALDALRTYAGRDALQVDTDALAGELRVADGNRGVAYLMRSLGMLEGDVESILSVYLRLCCVEVTSGDLARMAATLANGGVEPRTGRTALPRHHVRDVLSVVYTCGMYDYAGHWAFDVGVPAKSAVSGGIMAVIPGKMGIGVYSPGLDVYGNSVRGIQVCEQLSDRLGLHVFATEVEDAMLTPADPAP